jgi:hypothetical protein
MEQARIDRALNRIEGALSRIEQAATRPASAPTNAPDGTSNREAKLEARVRDALGELDSLIESLER